MGPCLGFFPRCRHWSGVERRELRPVSFLHAGFCDLHDPAGRRLPDFSAAGAVSVSGARAGPVRRRGKDPSLASATSSVFSGNITPLPGRPVEEHLHQPAALRVDKTLRCRDGLSPPLGISGSSAVLERSPGPGAAELSLRRRHGRGRRRCTGTRDDPLRRREKRRSGARLLNLSVIGSI